MLINAGIKEILYESGYGDELSREMLLEARIPVRQLSRKE
jgi:deoxycytidylate deaminase